MDNGSEKSMLMASPEMILERIDAVLKFLKESTAKSRLGDFHASA
jgi:hypothetical protein